MIGSRKTKRRIATVQMAPMIDMVFLLLVFFMCVSSISQAGSKVKLDLAESRRSEVSNDFSSRVVISISDSGDLYLNAYKVDIEELVLKIEALMSNTPQLKLSIRADQKVEYREIGKIIEAAGELGITEFIYSTHQIGD